MKNEKVNCCDTDNSNCNTQETNCCSTEQKSTGSNKKKVGLGVLLIAIIFAGASAFTMDSSTEKANCAAEKEGCETSCEVGSEETSCCSKD